MISKSSFFKILLSDMKQRMWIACITALVFLFVFLFPSFSIISEYREMRETDNLVNAASIMQGIEYLYRENPMVAFIIMAMATMLAVVTFSYLFSRKKTDYYHCLPIKREKLFAVKAFNSVFLFEVPYFVMSILSAVILSTLGKSPAIFAVAVKGFVLNSCMFLLFFAIAVLAVMLTGQIVVAFLGIGVFYCYFPLLGSMLLYLQSTFFSTFYGDYEFSIFRRVIEFSPFMYYHNFIFEGKVNTIQGCITSLFGSAVFIAAACLLYRKRPSEESSKAIVFKKAKLPIKCALVPLGALLIMFITYDMMASVPVALVCVVFGAIISHCILEIIYEFDFKCIFANKLHCAVLSVISFVIFSVFAFDVFGYDKYIPANDSVEYCGFVNENGILSEEMFFENKYFLENNISRGDIAKEMKLKDCSKITELVKKSLNKPADDYTYSYIVYYKLKNGRDIFRRYRVNYSDVRNDLKDIFDSEEYKALFIKNENYIGVNYKLFDTKYKLFTSDESEKTEALKEAYNKDIKAMTYDDFSKGSVLFYLQFKTDEYQKLADEYRKNGRLDDELGDYNYAPVLSSFENTLAFLEKEGKKFDFEPTANDVDYMDGVDATRITDNEKIAKLLSKVQPEPNVYEEVGNDCVHIAAHINDKALDKWLSENGHSLRDADEAEAVMYYVINEREVESVLKPNP